MTAGAAAQIVSHAFPVHIVSSSPVITTRRRTRRRRSDQCPKAQETDLLSFVAGRK